MPELIVKREAAIGRIVFSNPSKYNAMSRDMWLALPEALDALDADPEIRLIVLEGDGDSAFVSGADISQFGASQADPAVQAAYNAAVEQAYLAPVKCSKPVVARIRGICMGGGLGLAAACDLRFCRDDARFRMPAGRMGLGYSVVGVRRFMTVVGVANTFDMFFSARVFGAQEALRMGFVSQVAPRETFDAMFDEWCAAVVENAPLTLRALKRTVNELIHDPGDRDVAAAEAAIAACFASADYREGAAAFMEKRKPRFQGA
ncbi:MULTISPECIES: enoyl-CoA hydratase [Cupriavidus]|uniref:enoyl-CoA hydratase n=1 Tax=Cupriavidus sp. WS TaxID=1312922 RepID=UPI000365D45B|nr:enoyl-CoA hydratase [Cupriavidus sp. WS]